jgi:hypothetical protein
MTTLISILIALIVIGVLLWGISKILSVVSIPEPFKTIIWVVVVIISLITFLQISGLYTFPLR